MLDASRSVGVVEKLINPEARPQLDAENRKLQKQLVASHEKRQEAKLVPYAEALARRFRTDWATVDIPKPELPRPARAGEFPLDDAARLHRLVAVLPDVGAQRQVPADLRGSASWAKPLANCSTTRTSCSIASSRRSCSRPAASTAFGRPPAKATTSSSTPTNRIAKKLCRFHALRQQWERKGQEAFYSLADFIAPVDSGRNDYIGAFAVTAGIGADELAAKFEREHDDYNSILTKALADRLAEAFAEYLHAQARRDWGYGATKHFRTKT